MSDRLFKVLILRKIRARDGRFYVKRETRRAYSGNLEEAVEGFKQSAAYLGFTFLGEVEEDPQSRLASKGETMK